MRLTGHVAADRVVAGRQATPTLLADGFSMNSPMIEVLTHGFCFLLVSFHTSSRTRSMTVEIDTPGVSMWLSSADVKGLLPPELPSSATERGSVANAIRMPDVACVSMAPRPELMSIERVRTLPLAATERASSLAKGLSRQASRMRMLTRSSRCIWRRTRVDVDGAEVEIRLALQHRVGGQEVVVVANRDAVARIVDERRLGAVELGREFAERRAHGVVLEVVAFDHLEAEPLQGGRDGLGVGDGVGEGRHVLVGGVAHHQGDAPLGGGLGARQDHGHHDYGGHGSDCATRQQRTKFRQHDCPLVLPGAPREGHDPPERQ